MNNEKLPGILKFPLDWLDRITYILWAISGIAILLMSFVVAYGVVMRYVFRAVDFYSPEMTMILMLFCVMFSIAHTQRLGRHIRVDLLDKRFPKLVSEILLNIVGPLAGLTFVFFVFYYSLDDTLVALRFNQYTTNLLRIPTFPLKISIPLGAGMLCLVLIAQILRYSFSFGKNNENKSD